jgi:SAM-dependent methyltransferase
LPRSTRARVERVFPPELDPEHYRTIHADLRHFSEEELREHYAARGKAEGRQPNVLCSREMLRDLALDLGTILEIGPWTHPMFEGPNVAFFDVLTRRDLIAKAKESGLHAIDAIPEIDFVSAIGDLSVVPGTFDVVASSHAIEHQPDLVGHLNQVERLLEPGGFYFLWIPDKRYCLDHFQPESTVAEVIEAAVERRTYHTLGTLIAQEVMCAHNDPRRHWRGDHGPLPENPVAIIREVLTLYDKARARGEYVDRHAWQFTPDSFRAILGLLNELGLVALSPLRVYNTHILSNEFWAILQKPAS